MAKVYKVKELETNEVSDVVIEITKLSFEGNIIPNSWFDHITINTEKSTKADLLAIVILSEIIYWYRATEIRDEATGKTIGYKKRFRYDKLQKSYISIAEKFGQSKVAIKRAIDRLIELNLITREFRNVDLGEGMVISNSMYLEPIPETISYITYSKMHPPSLQKSKDTQHKKVKTYTKSTTKNTLNTSRRGVTPPSEVQKNTSSRKLKVYGNPQSLFDFYKPTNDREKHLLEVISNPDNEIIHDLPEFMGDYDTLDELDYLVGELLGNKDLPGNTYNKLRALERIVQKGEKESILKAIEIVKKRGKADSLSYLLGVIKKIQNFS